ncbi:hypothetical protein SAMN05216226_105178 [Halovenus aranensis]|uniref:Uncharacterized protein n=1 Tax=Halovenus aranensis TaxID=890420 RepID=A0A1G8UXE5_9EURY|nr:multidrug transporter [Halovenus aranensis]SDJ58399.1 hypothetical protein SAMN05216226_105178 [Halovenus aranensis]
MYRTNSSVETVVGLPVAAVAVVGTQVLGWEWGSGQLVPTVAGVTAAGAAVLIVAGRLRE